MIRAAFLSAGVYLVLCGAGLFFVDEVTLTERASDSSLPLVAMITTETPSGRRILDPPEWLPFTCIGVGVVTMLYAVALPRQ